MSPGRSGEPVHWPPIRVRTHSASLWLGQGASSGDGRTSGSVVSGPAPLETDLASVAGEGSIRWRIASPCVGRARRARTRGGRADGSHGVRNGLERPALSARGIGPRVPASRLSHSQDFERNPKNCLEIPFRFERIRGAPQTLRSKRSQVDPDRVGRRFGEDSLLFVHLVHVSWWFVFGIPARSGRPGHKFVTLWRATGSDIRGVPGGRKDLARSAGEVEPSRSTA